MNANGNVVCLIIVNTINLGEACGKILLYILSIFFYYLLINCIYIGVALDRSFKMFSPKYQLKYTAGDKYNNINSLNIKDIWIYLGNERYTKNFWNNSFINLFKCEKYGYIPNNFMDKKKVKFCHKPHQGLLYLQ